MHVPFNSGNGSGSSPRIVVLHCSSHGMPFREWNFAFRESVSELRELLREYPATLQQLREWPFHSESVLSEIGVVPMLPKFKRGFKQGPSCLQNWTLPKELRSAQAYDFGTFVSETSLFRLDRVSFSTSKWCKVNGR